MAVRVIDASALAARGIVPAALVFNTVNSIIVQGADFADFNIMSGFDVDITRAVPDGRPWSLIRTRPHLYSGSSSILRTIVENADAAQARTGSLCPGGMAQGHLENDRLCKGRIVRLTMLTGE